MKRSKIVVFLCLCFSVSVAAQLKLEGFKLGLNAVDVKCQETEIKSRSSFLAGVFFQWPLRKNLYLHPAAILVKCEYFCWPKIEESIETKKMI